MNALYFKGEDIILTFKSAVSLAGFTKTVKFFSPLSVVKTATITTIDEYSFTATLVSADTMAMTSGRLNIVVELVNASTKKLISKTVDCYIADAYTDGGTRAKVTNAFDIVFAQGQEIIIDFVGATMLSDAITKAEQATIAANEAAGDAIEINNSIASAEQLRASSESSRSSAESARASAEAARNVASNVYNITLAVPLAAGIYYTSTTARAAVPTAIRKRGLELIYETSEGVWYRERFIGASTTTWTTATDWELVPTKKYVDDGLNLKLNKSSIKKEFGTSETDVVAQKTISEAFASINEKWVGVIVDPALSCSEPAPKSTVVAYKATELQRTGSLEFHKFGKSRIFNAFYPAIVNRATKQVAWRLDKNNPALKEDGSPSVPDWTIHNICIVIPNLYRRIVLLDGNADGRYEIRYDITPFEGASLFHAESYHSIGEAQLDRTETKLVSVISDDVRFRGGGNQSAWDAQAWRSQLGMPLTDTSRINFELYANNAGWQTMNIYDHTLYSELAMLYFANTNIQLDYTSILTPEGYPQGGLGAGNSNWIGKRWSEKTGYYPIDKVGQAFMSVGCNAGVYAKTDNNYYVGSVTAVTAGKLVSTGNFSAANGWLATYIGYTVRNLTTNATATITAKDDDNILSLSDDIFTAVGQTFHIEGVSISYGIPVFFGLENLYGHLWKHCSGINYVVQAADAGGKSIAYVNPDWATRSAADVTAYQQVGEIPRTDGYIKTLYPGWNIVKSNAGAASNTFMSDYGYHANLPSTGSVIRCLLVSGRANHGAADGLRLADSYYAPSSTAASLGARLRALKQ